ncbi:GGDEF domain-containing protein [Streptomyces sp. ISL-99]|uniref:GGDEF domain-containing protein n=1 Tax=Streptomyces sp. ISL-99 TaxID=2819193 RepID=UPI001BE5F6E6|nr:GGDEF domain-containing protein [Streptomyces sp. ISL-99]MBT2524715.1 GGDEF domain-containing protein [Streptomyces sp. ISL-99]
MSQTLAALAAALPLASGWSIHSLRMRRRIEAARRDPLTGLWTRDPFEERACKSLAEGQQRAVYVVDLNWFKQINDTFGHAAGDAVIRATGQRFGEWTEDNAGIAGRLGGDEFAAITPVDGNTATVTDNLHSKLADLLDRLEQPVEFEGQDIDVYASIGAARYWRAGTADLSALLRRADEQMYSIKQEGGGYAIAPALGSVPEFRTVNGRREGRRGATGGTGAAA